MGELSELRNESRRNCFLLEKLIGRIVEDARVRVLDNSSMTQLTVYCDEKPVMALFPSMRLDCYGTIEVYDRNFVSEALEIAASASRKEIGKTGSFFERMVYWGDEWEVVLNGFQ